MENYEVITKNLPIEGQWQLRVVTQEDGCEYTTILEDWKDLEWYIKYRKVTQIYFVK